MFICTTVFWSSAAGVIRQLWASAWSTKPFVYASSNAKGFCYGSVCTLIHKYWMLIGRISAFDQLMQRGSFEAHFKRLDSRRRHRSQGACDILKDALSLSSQWGCISCGGHRATILPLLLHRIKAQRQGQEDRAIVSSADYCPPSLIWRSTEIVQYLTHTFSLQHTFSKIWNMWREHRHMVSRFILRPVKNVELTETTSDFNIDLNSTVLF